MSTNVHRESTTFSKYLTEEYVEVGTTLSGLRVTFERRTDICGKTGEPGTAAWSYNYRGDDGRGKVQTIVHHDVCRLSPGHDGDCTNDVVITDCCDRRVDAANDDCETVSNSEVTACNYGHGCNENTPYGY